MTSQIRLTWADYSQAEDELRVYRSTSPIDKTSLPAPLATVAASSTSYTDTTAADDTDYYYAVAPSNDNEVIRDWVSTYGPVRSAPSWKPVGVDWFVDFTTNQLWDQRSIVPEKIIADYRQSSLLMQNSSGDWVSKAQHGAGALTLSREDSVGLQVVPTRTNLVRNNSMTGAVIGTPGTSPTSWSTPSQHGLTKSVVAVGTVNGLPYVDIRYSGTASQAGFISPQWDVYSQFAAVQNNVFSHSVFMALQAGSLDTVNALTLRIAQYTAAGVYITETTSPITGLQFFDLKAALTSTLARYHHVGTASQATVGFVLPYFQFTYSNGAIIDFTLRIVAPQMELAHYPSNPILTTSASVQRLGNGAIACFSSERANLGMSGFVKFTLQEAGSHTNAIRIMNMLTTGFGGANQWRISHQSGTFRFVVAVSSLEQCNINLGTWATGDYTIVFSYGSNFAKARIVGGSDPAADTSVTVPTLMENLGIGGSGVPNTNNANCLIKKIGLKFGAGSQAEFDAMYTVAAAA